MTTWVKGIQAITLFAEDVPAMRTFYQDVFDLPVVFEDPHSVVFRMGETLINILMIEEAPGLIEPAPVARMAAGNRFQFTIGVEDVDATCADLANRGVTLLNGPMDRPWGIRTAAFQDPAGHIWEVGG